MVSNIDATRPITGVQASKQAQRDNWAAAKAEIEALQASVLVPRYDRGCLLSAGADPNNDISVSAGARADSTNARWIELTSAIEKDLNAPWAVGTGNGGLDTGTKQPSTTYHKWLILRSDTGVVDGLFSLSSSTPSLPTSYDFKAYLGLVTTDAFGNLESVGTIQQTTASRRLFESAELVIPGGGTQTDVRHGLGMRPQAATLRVRCLTAQGGWSVGDEIESFAYRDSPDEHGVFLTADATNLTFTVGSNGLDLFRKDNGENFDFTNANWRVILRAEAWIT